MDVWKPKVLVLGPGGAKGLLEVGAISYLEQINLLSDVEIFVGCSIGSVISLLMICGYGAQDMMIEGSNVSVFDNMDLDFKKMSDDVGIISMTVMSDRIESLVRMKIGKVPTLSELYMATGKSLFCTTYNITKKKTEYLSKESYPDLSCVKACMMSCAIPILFRRIEYNGCRYLDGAIGNPYPVNIFDDGDSDILGIYIKTMSSTRDTTMSYIIGIAETLIAMDQKRESIIKSSSSRCRHMCLNCKILDTTGASLDIGAKASLIIDGWNAARDIFPSKLTANGLEQRKNVHVVDNSSKSKVVDGEIIIRISQSTKLAIERMGISLDRANDTPESKDNKQ